jgi:eukaryotic-like serine/threonine-protein kinase
VRRTRTACRLPPLDTDETALIGLQLAAALRYLHHAGVVHLDVKPHNVALRDSRPVLLDFGTARRAGRRRRSGAPLGSPPYMAPEQCRDAPARPVTDAFGLGALLFEAATGEHPFHPRRAPDGWMFPQLTELAPMAGLPDGLRRPVAALLDPDPGRCPDEAAVLAALAAVAPAEDRPWPDWVDSLDNQ